MIIPLRIRETFFRDNSADPRGVAPALGIVSAVLALFLFTFAPGIHHVLHHHVPTASVDSECGHKSCSSEEAPTEAPDQSKVPNCETCEALATAFIILVQTPNLEASALASASLNHLENDRIKSWIETDHPGRSPPTI